MSIKITLLALLLFVTSSGSYAQVEGDSLDISESKELIGAFQYHGGLSSNLIMKLPSSLAVSRVQFKIPSFCMAQILAVYGVAANAAQLEGDLVGGLTDTYEFNGSNGAILTSLQVVMNGPMNAACEIPAFNLLMPILKVGAYISSSRCFDIYALPTKLSQISSAVLTSTSSKGTFFAKRSGWGYLVHEPRNGIDYRSRLIPTSKDSFYITFNPNGPDEFPGCTFEYFLSQPSQPIFTGANIEVTVDSDLYSGTTIIGRLPKGTQAIARQIVGQWGALTSIDNWLTAFTCA